MVWGYRDLGTTNHSTLALGFNLPEFRGQKHRQDCRWASCGRRGGAEGYL